ncbi:unnamed protein product [Prunus armeniaca]
MKCTITGLFSLRRFDEFAKINENDEKGRGGVFDPMASMANPFYISSSSKLTRKASVFTPNNLVELSEVRSIGLMAPTIADVHLGNQSYLYGKEVGYNTDDDFNSAYAKLRQGMTNEFQLKDGLMYKGTVSLFSAGAADGRNFWSFFFWMRGVPPPSPEFGLEWNVNRWMCCVSNF